MSVERNKGAAEAYFAEVLNRGDMEAADRIFAEDVAFHYPLGDLRGRDAIKTYLMAVREAFPDIHFAIAALAGEDRHAAARWTLSGTQTGPFNGGPPTGNRVEVPGVTWFDVDDGRIREMWVAFDPARLVSQDVG